LPQHEIEIHEPVQGLVRFRRLCLWQCDWDRENHGIQTTKTKEKQQLEERDLSLSSITSGVRCLKTKPPAGFTQRVVLSSPL
jgi:hypothetical protein